MLTNVLGTELRSCCRDPATGFYRDGYCRTGPEDTGLHTVCAEMTRDFLDYSVLMGNDLGTAHPEWGFAGWEPGTRWRACGSRVSSRAGPSRSSAVARRRLIARQHARRRWNSSHSSNYEGTPWNRK